MISIKSPRAEELPRGHLIALMTNDSRRSVTRRRPKIGSGEAAAPHSTPWGCLFASPRNRPDVASFHVPHPHVCGPQSHWDRWTSLHIRGARGPLRWRFHQLHSSFERLTNPGTRRPAGDKRWFDRRAAGRVRDTKQENGTNARSDSSDPRGSRPTGGVRPRSRGARNSRAWWG